MKILSLRVEQFKKFDQAVLVDGFGDGLNLLAGPNETGKSTLLLALRAALFERHSAKTQAVKDFSPHEVAGARPTVALDFEIGGERYGLIKHFLKRPGATLETSTGRRFEGSEAESELKRLLGLDPSEKTTAGKDSPAHFGVVLTPQARSFHQPDLADGTRHTLEAAITREIAELGNQSEVDGLLAEFDGMLDEIVYKRGEPKNRYKDVMQELADIERQIADAAQERAALEQQLDQLAEVIAERDALTAVDDSDNLVQRLASLEVTRQQASHRQTLDNRHLAARQRLQAAEVQRAARGRRLEERERVIAGIATIERTIEAVQSRLAMVQEGLSERERKLADLGETQRAAEGRRRDLEVLGRQMERLSQIEVTLSALATDVRLELAPGALDRVTLNGEPASSASDLRQVTEGLTIEIEGIGRIGIEPKTEPMGDALAAKAEAESRIETLLDTLDLDAREPEAIEAAWQAVAAELDALDAARRDLETARDEDGRQAAEAKAAEAASADRKAQLAERLAEMDAADGTEPDDPAALDAEIADARAAVEAAADALEAAPEGESQSAAQVDREIAELRGRIEDRRRAMEGVGKRVVALESAIAVRSGLGIDEKIDQLQRQRHLLTNERDAFALDHRALSLLKTTLRDAADEAKATFYAPLSARLAPYIQDLFPGASPVVTPGFSIDKLDRDGVEEPFPHLSDGTREQIAILARLAFADMLREQGLPALMVLDDALAFSDDQRFARMLRILGQAAQRMQVIILTCREDRFADVEATRLGIQPATNETPSAA